MSKQYSIPLTAEQLGVIFDSLDRTIMDPSNSDEVVQDAKTTRAELNTTVFDVCINGTTLINTIIKFN